MRMYKYTNAQYGTYFTFRVDNMYEAIYAAKYPSRVAKMKEDTLSTNAQAKRSLARYERLLRTKTLEDVMDTLSVVVLKGTTKPDPVSEDTAYIRHVPSSNTWQPIIVMRPQAHQDGGRAQIARPSLPEEVTTYAEKPTPPKRTVSKPKTVDPLSFESRSDRSDGRRERATQMKDLLDRIDRVAIHFGVDKRRSPFDFNKALSAVFGTPELDKRQIASYAKYLYDTMRMTNGDVRAALVHVPCEELVIKIDKLLDVARHFNKKEPVRVGGADTDEGRAFYNDWMQELQDPNFEFEEEENEEDEENEENAENSDTDYDVDNEVDDGEDTEEEPDEPEDAPFTRTTFGRRRRGVREEAFLEMIDVPSSSSFKTNLLAILALVCAIVVAHISYALGSDVYQMFVGSRANEFKQIQSGDVNTYGNLQNFLAKSSERLAGTILLPEEYLENMTDVRLRVMPLIGGDEFSQIRSMVVNYTRDIATVPPKCVITGRGKKVLFDRNVRALINEYNLLDYYIEFVHRILENASDETAPSLGTDTVETLNKHLGDDLRNRMIEFFNTGKQITNIADLMSEQTLPYLLKSFLDLVRDDAEKVQLLFDAVTRQYEDDSKFVRNMHRLHTAIISARFASPETLDLRDDKCDLLSESYSDTLARWSGTYPDRKTSTEVSVHLRSYTWHLLFDIVHNFESLGERTVHVYDNYVPLMKEIIMLRREVNQPEWALFPKADKYYEIMMKLEELPQIHPFVEIIQIMDGYLPIDDKKDLRTSLERVYNVMKNSNTNFVKTIDEYERSLEHAAYINTLSVFGGYARFANTTLSKLYVRRPSSQIELSLGKDNIKVDSMTMYDNLQDVVMDIIDNIDRVSYRFEDKDMLRAALSSSAMRVIGDVWHMTGMDRFFPSIAQYTPTTGLLAEHLNGIFSEVDNRFAMILRSSMNLLHSELTIIRTRERDNIGYVRTTKYVMSFLKDYVSNNTITDSAIMLGSDLLESMLDLFVKRIKKELAILTIGAQVQFLVEKGIELDEAQTALVASISLDDVDPELFRNPTKGKMSSYIGPIISRLTGLAIFLQGKA